MQKVHFGSAKVFKPGWAPSGEKNAPWKGVHVGRKWARDERGHPRTCSFVPQTRGEAPHCAGHVLVNRAATAV